MANNPWDSPNTRRRTKKKSGGSPLGFLARLGKQSVSDLGSMARDTPAGVAGLGKAVGHDVFSDVRRGRLPSVPDLLLTRKGHTAKIARGMAKGTYQDLRHPLRHPGYTVLDIAALLAPALKGAGIGAATARGVSSGGKVGRSLRLAIAEANAPKTRTIRYKPRNQQEKDFFSQVLGLDKPVTREVKQEPKPPRAGLPKASFLKVGKMDMGKRARYGQWEEIAKEHGVNTKSLRKFIDSNKPTNESVKKWLFDPREVAPKNVVTSKRGVGPEITRQVNLSKVPTTRALQNLKHSLIDRSPGLSRRRMEKKLARDIDLLSRPGMADSPRFLESLAALKDPQTWKNTARHPIRETNAGVRGVRLYRFGYIAPNWLGSKATAAIKIGKDLPQVVAMEKRLRKSHPEEMKAIDRTQGETAAGSAADLAEKPSDMGAVSSVAHGVGNTLGRFIDRPSRAQVFLKEAMDWGFTEEEIPALMREVMDIESARPAALRKFALIADTAERDAIKFTRTKQLPGRAEGLLSRVDRRLARHLFLYKWITGSAQFSARMLAEHPNQSWFLAQLGRDDNVPKIGDVLKEYPEFMAGMVPAGMRGKLPLALNTQAASLFDMPGEVAGTLRDSFVDPLQLANRLNPVEAAAAIGWAKEDPFTHQQLAPHGHPNLWERTKFGSKTQLRGNPYVKLARIFEDEKTRSRRLHPQTPADILLEFFLSSTFAKKPINPKVASQMYRRDLQHYGRKPRKTKKQKSSKSNPWD